MGPRKTLANGDNKVAPQALNDDTLQSSNLGKRKRGDGGEVDGDPKLQEFLEVMQPPSKSRTWANEDSAGTQNVPQQNTHNQVHKVQAAQSDEEYEAVPQRSKRSKKSEDVDEPVGLAEEVNATGRDTEDIGTNLEDAEYGNSLKPASGKVLELPNNTMPAASDEDWLRSRTSRLLGLIDDEDSHESRCLPEVEEKVPDDLGVLMQPWGRETSDASVQTDEVINRADVVAAEQVISGIENPDIGTGRLFVRNLMYTTTELELRKHFDALECGPIEEV